MATAAMDALDVEALNEVVRPIILTQGNKFIKELLRRQGLPIGSTKADFSKNIHQAIDEGRLTQAMIEEWLSEVEGWGNQHIYLYEPLRLDLGQIRAAIGRSDRRELLERPVSYDFPDALSLAAISIDAERLSLSWHRSQDGWERAKSKDFQREEEDGDLYEYRAFRLRYDRRVVRFEWRLADPYSALLVQLPHERDEHEEAIAQVEEDLLALGLIEQRPARIQLSRAFKALTRAEDITVQSAKMMTDGGHVELVATLADGGIADVEAVREVRRGVDDARFATADGMFSLAEETNPRLSRTIKVQGYGLDSRIRIWVQCKRDDVYEVIGRVWAQNVS